MTNRSIFPVRWLSLLGQHGRLHWGVCPRPRHRTPPGLHGLNGKGPITFKRNSKPPPSFVNREKFCVGSVVVQSTDGEQTRSTAFVDGVRTHVHSVIQVAVVGHLVRPFIDVVIGKSKATVIALFCS